MRTLNDWAALSCVAMSPDHDPIAVLKQTPSKLMAIVERHSAETLRQRPFEGKWTPNEILGHLVDHEIVSMCRIRTTRMDEVPWLERYDQERWVVAQGHNERDPHEFARRFAELRALNLEQYESLSPDELARPKLGSDGSEVTLEHLLRIHAGHDLSHLDQIARYVQAVTGDA